MKNSKGIFLVLITVLSVAIIAFYGLRQVSASENHKHDAGHDDHETHDHDDDHGEDSHDQDVIKLSEESQKLGNIKVISIASEPLIQKVLVNGRIAQDVENVKHVHSTISGDVKESFVSLGQSIQAGERLCSIAAQTSGEITEIKASLSGTIIAEFIKKGDYVDGTNALYTIADMTRLSANFDVYEKDLAHIQLGQKMKVFPIAYPDRSFVAEIVFISPRVDESTFTTRIKAFVDNPVQLLKLGMSVRGEIEVVEDTSYLTLPSDAVQNVDGKDVVFVQTDHETFEKRVVEIKSRVAKEVAISGDLKKGDDVVVSGAFILKSKLLESQMEHAHDH